MSTTGRERGSGSVLVLGVAAVTLVVLVAAVSLAGTVRARHVAESAADLAALAAAVALEQGVPPAVACARAADVARPQGATVVCRTDGADALVEARAPVPSAVAALGGAAAARARAGPSRESDAIGDAYVRSSDAGAGPLVGPRSTP